MKNKFSLNIHGNLVILDLPIIMGILNITPDSFSDGGSYLEEKNMLIQVEKMINDGAKIIDIGAQSTRPTSQKVSSNEEIKRLGSRISTIKKMFPNVLISLDTFYGDVVDFGFNEGIDIVNDISGGEFCDKMLPTVSKIGLPYILMHSNNSYESMHEIFFHSEIITSLNSYFSKKISNLYNLGIKDIILDPGFGFGKSIEDQYKILENLDCVSFRNFPLLIGISRKSFIYKPLDKNPLDVDPETQKLHLNALINGAKILRVHDVNSTAKTVSEFLNFY